MKRSILAALCLAVQVTVWTQNSQPSVQRPYFYDEFKSGIAFFSSGEVSVAEFNYNFVLQEMQFLDRRNNNQILNLVRQSSLTHIEIGKDIFVPAGKTGYAVVIQDGPVTLMKKRHLIRYAKKTGAYGTSATTASIDLVDYLSTGVDLVTSQSTQFFNPEYSYLEKNEYFLMKNKKTYTATRKNFLRLFSEIKPQLEKFISENNIDFRNEQHLRGLTKYANSLLLAN
jgi:hypothetical protein